VKRADSVGVGAIEHAASVAANVDQADVAKNAQMFGDGGLFEAERIDDITDGTFVESEKGKDVAAARFGDGVEGVGGGGGARHKKRIHSHIGICQEDFFGRRTSTKITRVLTVLKEKGPTLKNPGMGTRRKSDVVYANCD
jgi:hypothetical protein